jgi:RluA family pseudouridine synthase
MDPLYCDSALLVLDKPAGMPVLPDGWDKDAPYLVQLLEQQFGKVWVVHRLDKITSGVMVFARTAESHRGLGMQFERREARKIYHAICSGAPAWDEHTARHKLRVNVGHSHRTVVDNGKGIAAETRFSVLRRYASHALLECAPATGRTHQIRVHAYALGYPLLGDTLYSAPATDLIPRPALHAFSLTFTHPVSAESISFEAPYPDDFAAALTRLAGSEKVNP